MSPSKVSFDAIMKNKTLADFSDDSSSEEE
jgi:hypothetical protein